ncbi:MAG TPA: hypothetical protein VGJ00_08475, partial [Rhabdochlamydiaceae bacterium]
LSSFKWILSNFPPGCACGLNKSFIDLYKFFTQGGHMTWKIIPSHLAAPSCTDKPFIDLMTWLDEGSIVLLYANGSERPGIVFDKQCRRKKGEVFRVIWMNFCKYTDLLEEKKIPQMLKARKYKLCTCSIAKKIAEQEILSHRTYRYDLGDGLRPIFPRYG